MIGSLLAPAIVKPALGDSLSYYFKLLVSSFVPLLTTFSGICESMLCVPQFLSPIMVSLTLTARYPLCASVYRCNPVGDHCDGITTSDPSVCQRRGGLLAFLCRRQSGELWERSVGNLYETVSDDVLVNRTDSSLFHLCPLGWIYGNIGNSYWN